MVMFYVNTVVFSNSVFELISYSFYGYSLVGTLFIDTGNIYCFGTGLLVVMSKDIYQCHYFK